MSTLLTLSPLYLQTVSRTRSSVLGPPGGLSLTLVVEREGKWTLGGEGPMERTVVLVSPLPSKGLVPTSGKGKLFQRYSDQLVPRLVDSHS